jgi:hypothetical protein
MESPFKQFDPRTIVMGRSLVFVGMRCTGKTTAVKHILRVMNHPDGSVICGKEMANCMYATTVLPENFHEEYSPELLNTIMRAQRQRVREAILPYFLVLDDCLYDNTWRRNRTIHALLKHSGVMFHTTFFITMQYGVGIPPSLQASLDYVFIFRENHVSNRERLYKYYADIFPTFELFCSAMNLLTEPYACLVIDNMVRSDRWTDCVFYWRAERI